GTADQLSIGGPGMDLAGALVQATGIATVKVFDLVSGTVAFTFQQQTVDADLNGDGILQTAQTGTAWARGPPGPDLHSATLTTLGLSIVQGQPLTVGVGGIGLTITGGTLAV